MAIGDPATYGAARPSRIHRRTCGFARGGPGRGPGAGGVA